MKMNHFIVFRGSIEFGEPAKEAIIRELMEEYDLKIDVQELAVVNEHIFEWNNEKDIIVH